MILTKKQAEGIAVAFRHLKTINAKVELRQFAQPFDVYVFLWLDGSILVRVEDRNARFGEQREFFESLEQFKYEHGLI